MMRIFMDSSVIFSAGYSPRGHSRDLLRAAMRGEIELVMSPTVLEETRRNLAESAPRAMPYLEFVLAKRAGVEMLVTLDKKQLLGRPELARFVGADIVTPKEAMARLSG
jgi:predicted nucleic acid-binding protein